MSNEVVDSQIPEAQASEYANEWVAHLRKQGRTRLMMLVVAIAALILSSAAFVKVFIDKQGLEMDVATKSAQIEKLEGSVEQKASQIASLTQDLSKVSKQRDFLEQIKGDTASQLNIAEQIIETQKQKIALIENEFSESKSMVNSLEGQVTGSQQEMLSLQKKITQAEKKLKQRSSAYEALVRRHKETTAELDRLTTMVDKAEASKKLVSQKLAAAKNQLASTQRELQLVKKDMEDMKAQAVAVAEPVVTKDESHHKLAMQPIIGQSSSEPSSSSSASNVVDPNQLIIH